MTRGAVARGYKPQRISPAPDLGERSETMKNNAAVSLRPPPLFQWLIRPVAAVRRIIESPSRLQSYRSWQVSVNQTVFVSPGSTCRVNYR